MLQQAGSNAMAISLLIVDPNPASCDSLVAGLISMGQFDRVSGTHTVRAARRLAQTHEFHIALISALQDSRERAYDLIGALAGLPRPIRSLVIARDWRRSDIIQAFSCGAKGLLLYTADLPQVSKAIACVMAGQVWANSEQLNHTLDYLVGDATNKRRPAQAECGLTSREQQIAQLLAQGASNKEIAKALTISERTVKNHLRNIFEKIGVSSRVQAALRLVG